MRKIAPAEWPAALTPAFDADCLARYHVAAPCTSEQAVASSLAVLQSHVAEDFVLYALPGEVGFVGVEPSLNFLTTFALYPGQRTAENARHLWAAVRTLLQPKQVLRAAVYARNTPARRFLRRAGFTAVQVVPHPLTCRVIFVYSLAPSLCL